MKLGSMPMNPRLLVLGGVAVVCAYLAFSGEPEAPAPVAAVSRTTPGGAGDAARRDGGKRVATAAAVKSLALERLDRGEPSKASSDLFAAAGWNAPPKMDPAKAPPKPPAAELPPPKPVAPPLPFQFFGHMQDEEVASVFLTQGPRNHVVKAGDTIDNTYRVESITPQKIVFRYIPLDQTQELARGTPN